jgi:hypothetical protein
MVISESWWIGKDLVGSGRGLILRYYPGISPEGHRKITKNSIRKAGSRAEIWTGTFRIRKWSDNRSTTTFGLMTIKICCTTSYGREGKPSVPYRKILRHVEDPYRYVKNILLRKNTWSFLAKFLLLRYQMSAGYLQRALVEEPGFIITQVGTQNRSETAAALGTPFAIPLRNRNSGAFERS